MRYIKSLAYQLPKSSFANHYSKFYAMSIMILLKKSKNEYHSTNVELKVNSNTLKSISQHQYKSQAEEFSTQF